MEILRRGILLAGHKLLEVGPTCSSRLQHNAHVLENHRRRSRPAIESCIAPYHSSGTDPDRRLTLLCANVVGGRKNRTKKNGP